MTTVFFSFAFQQISVICGESFQFLMERRARTTDRCGTLCCDLELTTTGGLYYVTAARGQPGAEVDPAAHL